MTTSQQSWSSTPRREPELSAQSYDSLAFRITIQSKRGDARTPKGRLRKLITKNDLQKQMLRPVLTHCWSKVTTGRSLYHGMKLFAYFEWNQSALETGTSNGRALQAAHD